MALVRVSAKYQITIPKVIRTELDIKPGQRMLITNVKDGILLTPVPPDPIDYLCSIFKDQPSLTEELLFDRKLELEHEKSRP